MFYDPTGELENSHTIVFTLALKDHTGVFLMFEPVTHSVLHLVLSRQPLASDVLSFQSSVVISVDINQEALIKV